MAKSLTKCKHENTGRQNNIDRIQACTCGVEPSGEKHRSCHWKTTLKQQVVARVLACVLTVLCQARAHAQRAAAQGKAVPTTILLATDAADVVEELREQYVERCWWWLFDGCCCRYGDEFTWLYRAETYRHTEANVTWM